MLPDMSSNNEFSISNGSGWLTRSEAARRLGYKSVGGIRALERAGILVGEIHGGIHVFSLEEVDRIAADRRAGRPGTASAPPRPAAVHPPVAAVHRSPHVVEGSIAAEAFAALDDGAEPADLVRSMALAPSLALQLANDHGRLRGMHGRGGQQQEYATRVDAEVRALRGEIRSLAEALDQRDGFLRGLVVENATLHRRLGDALDRITELQEGAARLKQDVEVATLVAVKALGEARDAAVRR